MIYSQTHRSSNTLSGGYFYILVAATLWGTTGTSQALAPAGVNPLAIGTMRILIGGIALLGLAVIRGGFRQRQAWHIPTTVAAALTTALYQITFFGATYRTGVAVGTVIGIGSAPLFAGLLGMWFDGERLSKRWILATLIALTGVILLTVSGNTSMNVDLLGVLLALGAGLSYAIFTLVNKRLVAAHPSDEVMAVTFCLGALLLLPLLFFVNVAWIATSSGLLVVLHLGLIATGLSYAFFGRGLRTVPVSIVGTLTLAEPLTAALLGLFLLHEPITIAALGGMGLIFGGLAVLTIKNTSG